MMKFWMMILCKGLLGMTIEEVVELLEELNIDFDSLIVDAKGVRVVKEVDDTKVPIFLVDEFEKLEEILIDIKNGFFLIRFNLNKFYSSKCVTGI